MSLTTVKGDLGEAMVIADCTKRGYKVSIPISSDSKYDLIVDRGATLDRIQVKYTESDGNVIRARAYRRNSKGMAAIPYSQEDIDWFAVYDKTTDRCYYIPAEECKGKVSLGMRVNKAKNLQEKNINLAHNYLDF